MKKLLFGMAFFMGAMMFSSGNLEAKTEEEPEIMRWLQIECDQGGFIEMCLYSGDGNVCYIHGDTTRDCPPS